MKDGKSDGGEKTLMEHGDHQEEALNPGRPAAGKGGGNQEGLPQGQKRTKGCTGRQETRARDRSSKTNGSNKTFNQTAAEGKNSKEVPLIMVECEKQPNAAFKLKKKSETV